MSIAAAPDLVPMTVAEFRQRTLRASAWRATWLVAADGTALAVAFLLAALATLLFSAHQTDGTYGGLVSADRGFRMLQVAGFGGALLIWMFTRGHYNLRLPFWIEMRHMVTGCAFVLLGDGFLQFALKEGFSRLWLVHTWVLAVPALLLARRIARFALRTAGLWELPALLVGSRARLDDARALIEAERSLGYTIVATRTLESLDGSWLAHCHACRAQMVVLAADEADMIASRELISRLALERIAFVCLQSLGGLPVFSLNAHHFVGREVLLLVGQSQLLHPLGQAAKTVFDYTVAALLLVASLPFFALFSALIARDGGPVFYGHARLGANGRKFRCLKFRTMVHDADRKLDDLLACDPAARAEWEASRKLQHDPRITPTGHFLRRFSLDELPQLLNVLRGDMSLVGPRPIHAAEVERFGADIDYYLQVKPGITGLWQVSGRNSLDYQQRIALNTWYVKNWSLWLDIVILMKTVPTVLSRHGAY